MQNLQYVFYAVGSSGNKGVYQGYSFTGMASRSQNAGKILKVRFWWFFLRLELCPDHVGGIQSFMLKPHQQMQRQ